MQGCLWRLLLSRCPVPEDGEACSLGGARGIWAVGTIWGEWRTGPENESDLHQVPPTPARTPAWC